MQVLNEWPPEWDKMESDFGQRLRMVRYALGVTQTEIANMVGESKQCISDWECVRRFPTTGQVRSIAIKLNVPFEWLCGLGPTFAWQTHEK